MVGISPKRLLGLVLLSCLATTGMAASTPRFMDMPPEAIDAALAHAQTLALNERIRYVSERYLGTPYKMGPLGEGPEAANDPDPLFRLDAVDCVTFLEQLWGMLWSDTLEKARATTQKIRYKDGLISYPARHHLMWAQWLPDNEAAGYIVDITSEIAGKAVVEQTKTYTPHSCAGRWESFCKDLGERMPQGPFTRPVLPLDAALKRIRAIPHGTLLFIVLKDRAALPYRIKHAGLVIHAQNGRVKLRHASAVHHAVVDVSLYAYVEMLKTKTENWQAVGLIAVKMQPPAVLRPTETEDLPTTAKPD